MYYSWLKDEEEKHEFARAYAILTGSFSDLEMAQKMTDDSRVRRSSDEDFERSVEMLEEASKALDKEEQRSKRKRNRKKIKLNESE